MADKIETEYGGTGSTNTVGHRGPEERKLSTSEKLRLGYLTGQEEEPEVTPKPGFFYGVDPDFPEYQKP